MKFIVIACLIALAAAAPFPQETAANAPAVAAPTPQVTPVNARANAPASPQDIDTTSLIRNDRVISADGFSYNIELSDGTKLQQEGKPLPDTGALAQTGSIEWVFPDGKLFKLTYIADENGYRPTSDFLPVFGVPGDQTTLQP